MSGWDVESAARANAELEGATAREIADWAATTFGAGLVAASSMQDLVVAHLMSVAKPGIGVVFLDTGYHFQETLDTRDAASRELDITVINATPTQTVEEQDAVHGKDLFARDPNTCCFMRKVDPLARALEPYDAWVTGARRAEAATRSELRTIAWDQLNGLVKVNPLALWTDEDVEKYQAEHNLPRNPLVAQGFPSIGCAPCTRQVAPGEDPRSGRWAGTDKIECGIHA